MIDNQNDAERVHELFARIADDPAPPLGFTADGIADAGRRGARTRRIGTVGGATAGLAALAIAVVTLPGAVAAGRGSSAGTPVGVPSARSEPSCVSEVAVHSAQMPKPDQTHVQLAFQMCPALRAINAVLDPTGKYVTQRGGIAGPPMVPPDLVLSEAASDASGNPISVRDLLCYNERGTAAAPFACDDLPSVSIEIIFSLPGAPDPVPRWDAMTPADRAPGPGPGSAAWVTKEVAHEGDSTITVGEVRDGDRVALKARRVLASGAALTIVASDNYGSTSKIEQPGSVYNPFPFTIAQMKAAVEVEELVTTDALKPYPVESPTYQQLKSTSTVPPPSSSH